MQITQATEYAVRCALHLARRPAAGVVSRRAIATEQEIPGPFLAKIAQQLARAGFIRIHQGAQGGYELLVPARRLTLLQVVEAMEGGILLNTCVLHPVTCARARGCAVHRVWGEARRHLRATLAGVTFADLAARKVPPNRKKRKTPWTR